MLASVVAIDCKCGRGGGKAWATRVNADAKCNRVEQTVGRSRPMLLYDYSHIDRKLDCDTAVLATKRYFADHPEILDLPETSRAVTARLASLAIGEVLKREETLQDLVGKLDWLLEFACSFHALEKRVQQLQAKPLILQRQPGGQARTGVPLDRDSATPASSRPQSDVGGVAASDGLAANYCAMPWARAPQVTGPLLILLLKEEARSYLSDLQLGIACGFARSGASPGEDVAQCTSAPDHQSTLGNIFQSVTRWMFVDRATFLGRALRANPELTAAMVKASEVLDAAPSAEMIHFMMTSCCVAGAIWGDRAWNLIQILVSEETAS
jgi:hypothetical protein